MTNEGIQTKNPSASKSAIWLAVATYVDVAYGVFLLPVLLSRGLFSHPHSSSGNKAVSSRKRHQTNFLREFHHDWKIVLTLYIIYLGSLHFLASLLVGGGWNAYKKVMIRTILPNVAFVEQDKSGSFPGPSMGLHW